MKRKRVEEYCGGMFLSLDRDSLKRRAELMYPNRVATLIKGDLSISEKVKTDVVEFSEICNQTSMLRGVVVLYTVRGREERKEFIQHSLLRYQELLRGPFEPLLKLLEVSLDDGCAQSYVKELIVDQLIQAETVDDFLVGVLKHKFSLEDAKKQTSAIIVDHPKLVQLINSDLAYKWAETCIIVQRISIFGDQTDLSATILHELFTKEFVRLNTRFGKVHLIIRESSNLPSLWRCLNTVEVVNSKPCTSGIFRDLQFVRTYDVSRLFRQLPVEQPSLAQQSATYVLSDTTLKQGNWDKVEFRVAHNLLDLVNIFPYDQHPQSQSSSTLYQTGTMIMKQIFHFIQTRRKDGELLNLETPFETHLEDFVHGQSNIGKPYSLLIALVSNPQSANKRFRYVVGCVWFGAYFTETSKRQYFDERAKKVAFVEGFKLIARLSNNQQSNTFLFKHLFNYKGEKSTDFHVRPLWSNIMPSLNLNSVPSLQYSAMVASNVASIYISLVCKDPNFKCATPFFDQVIEFFRTKANWTEYIEDNPIPDLKVMTIQLTAATIELRNQFYKQKHGFVDILNEGFNAGKLEKFVSIKE